MTAEASQEKKTISRRESLAILLASLMAAVSAFIATVIAQRSLTAQENTDFLLFWSLLFGVFGLISGLQQETTRAVGARQLALNKSAPGARVLPLGLGLGLLVALLVLLTAPLWAAQQFGDQASHAVLLIALGSLLYSAHSVLSGASAGRENWFLFAALGGGEALWRLLAMGLAGFFLASLLSLEVAVISASFYWILLLLFSSRARSTAVARADVPTPTYISNVLLAMGSSTASSVLTVAFPTLLMLSIGSQTNPLERATLGLLVLAVSITRSPIMIPLQAFQGVAISAFLKQRHRPLAALARPVFALLGIGALGALAAYLIGPWLFSLIYERKPDALQAYDLVNQGWVLGGLTLASAFMALLVLSGTAVLALNAHRLYLTGWVLAALVTALLLFCLPLDLIPRAILALYLGPIMGFAYHLLGIIRLAPAFRVEEEA